MWEGMEIPEMGAVHILEVYEYYDGPQLLACHIGSDIYLALALPDSGDLERWLLARMSPGRLLAVRRGDLGLRQSIARTEDGAVILLDVDADEVIRRRVVAVGEVAERDMPSAEGRLQRSDESRPASLRVGTRPRADRLEFHMEHSAAGDEVIAIDHLGTLLLRFQATLRAFGAPPTAGRGALPGRADAKFTMLAVPVAAGSFRLRLVAADLPDMFGNPTETTKALERFMRIWETDQPVAVVEQLRNAGPRCAIRYSRFVSALTAPIADVTATWEAPSGQVVERQRTYRDLSVLRGELVVAAEQAAVSRRVITGVLMGADFARGTFRLQGEDGGTYTGALADSVAEARLPLHASALLEERLLINKVTEEETVAYTLLAFGEPTDIEEAAALDENSAGAGPLVRAAEALRRPRGTDPS